MHHGTHSLRTEEARPRTALMVMAANNCSTCGGKGTGMHPIHADAHPTTLQKIQS